jgi:hypothetical protein
MSDAHQQQQSLLDPAASAELARFLTQTVRALGFADVPDAWNEGRSSGQMPGLDLAVIAFADSGLTAAADVLFSPEFPQGRVAHLDERTLAVDDIVYVPDIQDSEGRSPAWLPRAERNRWLCIDAGSAPGHQEDKARFIAPYPASLIKLMVAVGVARLVDLGLVRWGDPCGPAEYGMVRACTVADCLDGMLTISSNDATDRLVALLHARGLIQRGETGEYNALHDWFARYGLRQLRLANTRPHGGWRNADGAGVGHLQMTAWDTARLLWLLMPDAPRAPWLDPGTTPLLQAQSVARLRLALAQQGLHEVLSAGLLAGLDGWLPGIAARVPARWRHPDGGYAVVARRYPPPKVTPPADADFCHKTGCTDTYCSDAGWVLGDDGRRYVVAMISTLGRRHAPPDMPLCTTDWRIPTLGGRIDAWVRDWTAALR